jgi:hypothetical protein
MPRPFEFIDDVPRSPGDGETVTYIDDGNLVTVTKHNGEEYKTVAKTGENTSASDTIDTMEYTEDSIGGANFSINIGANNIDVRDSTDTQRAIFGQITSTDYGIKCMDSSSNELIGLYGTQNTIAGWSVTSSYIHNSSQNNQMHLYLMSGDDDNLPRLNVRHGNNDIFNAGVIEANNSGVQIKNSSNQEVFRIDSTGACNIAGWTFSDEKLASAADGAARIELNSDDMRVAVMKSDNSTLTAMGYLGGLVKNNSTGNYITSITGSGSTATITIGAITDEEHEKAFNPDTLVGLKFWMSSAGTSVTTGQMLGVVASNTFNTITLTGAGIYTAIGYSLSNNIRYYVLKFVTDDYGFWAVQGDKMRIDGDVEYDSGDWLIHSDGALKFTTGTGLEVMRLGTHTGDRGLFIGANLNTTAPLASYTSSKILIGVENSGNYLKYTTAGGLILKGDITVLGDLSQTAYETFKNTGNGTGATVLDTNHWNIIGDLTQKQSSTGMECWDLNMNAVYDSETGTWSSDGWDVGFRYKAPFKREDNPVLTWDVKLLKSGNGGAADQAHANDNRYEMIGWFDSVDDPTLTYYNISYGVYFVNDDANWHRNNTNGGAIFTNKPEYAGATFRLVITVKKDGGAFGVIYKDGDFTTPFATKDWGTTGTETNLYLGNAARNSSSGKMEHQQVAAGNVAPSVPTKISGGLITTGKIQSTDTKTFFDLDADRMIVNDGSNDRVLIGDIGGSSYGLKVSLAGNDVKTAAGKFLTMSSDWAIPKLQFVNNKDTITGVNGRQSNGDLTYSLTQASWNDDNPSYCLGGGTVNTSTWYQKYLQLMRHEETVRYLRMKSAIGFGTGAYGETMYVRMAIHTLSVTHGIIIGVGSSLGYVDQSKYLDHAGSGWAFDHELAVPSGMTQGDAYFIVLSMKGSASDINFSLHDIVITAHGQSVAQES